MELEGKIISCDRIKFPNEIKIGDLVLLCGHNTNKNVIGFVHSFNRNKIKLAREVKATDNGPKYLKLKSYKIENFWGYDIYRDI